jgi:photosystem II stability/assembly factor-like uncharacterized protein
MALSRGLLGVLACLLLFASCKKEKAVDKVVESFQLPTTLNITDIELRTTDEIWCSAGIRFGEGRLYRSVDAGQNWSEILSHPQEINDFDFWENSIEAYPYGNKLKISTDSGQSFNSLALPAWHYYAAGSRTTNYSYMVAGENFGSGQIIKFNHNDLNSTIDSLQHELTDIHCWNDSSCITVGYGVILKSTNGGEHWVPDDARGDFYKAIDFADEQTAYVVGDYGSIWKTSDRGENWKKIRSGSTFLNNHSRFTDVSFQNAEEGAIVGKNGLCWLTYNGGESWVPVRELAEVDFSTVYLANNRVYIGAVGGMLYHFEF